ncbi:Exportin-T [Talaromyces islandicus]|uniref:Exportin-T n=1 Tax=Talaromyces islandicus TaxID=28573 RepID=A0A0U1LZU2_TALIS|nr:Exportin-T [Talaromyces islandicus]
MAQPLVEKKQRRKSFTFFHSSSATTLPAAAHDRSSSDGLSSTKKRARRNSGFFGARDPSPGRSINVLRRPQTSASESAFSTAAAPDGHKQHRKSLQRNKRSSMLGSLRSLQSFEDDTYRSALLDDDDSNPPSPHSKRLLGHVVLHHGEVQTAGTMWRKRHHYLVLTDTHLIRFKSQGKASDLFPTISAPSGRTTPVNRQSVVSLASLQDHSVSAYSSDIAAIALNSIVSVHRADDLRHQSTLELSYLDDRTSKAALMAIQLADPEELNLWLIGIRSAAYSMRSVESLPFESRAMENAIRVLEQDRDYDPENFQLFRVVQRSSNKLANRSSADETVKLSATVYYLAIGLHKIHLLPLQKQSSRSSLISLNELDGGASFGLMALTSLVMHSGDDRFQLTFRVPLGNPCSLPLASVSSVEIAMWIRQRTEFLRPLWLCQPYEIIAPAEVAHGDLIPTPEIDEDFGCFDRTLIAYSASYAIDTSNICYTIDLDCEDAPCFRLLPPAASRRQQYTVLELLAVMRALRYNETFVSISFSGINLDSLQKSRDSHGLDPDILVSRTGAPVNIAGQDRLSLLSQEIRALALKSKRLRKVDFSFCLSRTPISDSGARDPGCGIPEAIFPLCRRQYTNVDWIVLNGIKLGDSDLDYLVDAASQRTSHLRALEVGDCGLSVHDLDLILSTLVTQEATLEAINISGIQGRLSPELFQQQIGYFGHIRKVNLTRVARTSGPDPLIAPETLLNWRLEELSLSQTAMNEQTVDSIAAYLASDRSSSLKTLRFDQCGLTGADVATFLRCLTRKSRSAREMHLHVNENNLDTDYTLLFQAIAENHTPTHLSMRMIDFKKEEHFRELVEALRKNTTLRYLDISKASLPYDAGPETCEALQLMFEENETLEELDISGEYAHLDVARFGIGLNQALTGLKKNKSLRVLRIEHQKLGLPGASTLATVLEENSSLREIYCDNNDMNLQSFTVLVNGLQQNNSVILLPTMTSDRHNSLEKIRREIENIHRETTAHPPHSAANSLRRSLHAAISIGQPSGGHKLAKHQTPHQLPKGGFIGSYSSSQSLAEPSASDPVRHEVETTLFSLNNKWDDEVDRLRQYLYRNYCILHDIPLDSIDPTEIDPDKPTVVDESHPGMTSDLLAMLGDMHKLDVNGPAGISSQVDALGSENDALEDSSASGSPVVTMSSSFSTRTLESLKMGDTTRPLSPTSLASEKAAAHISTTEYTASANSSPQLALPVPAIRKTTHTAESIRSTCSSSNMSSSTGTGSKSFNSTSGLAASSLRKLLPNRQSAMRGMRQFSSFGESKEAPRAKTPDVAPQLNWTLPQMDLE